MLIIFFISILKFPPNHIPLKYRCPIEVGNRIRHAYHGSLKQPDSPQTKGKVVQCNDSSNSQHRLVIRMCHVS